MGKNLIVVSSVERHLVMLPTWRHTQCFTAEKPYDCCHCGKEFRKASNIKRHKEAVHQELGNLECDEQVYNSLDCYKWVNNSLDCPNCGKGLTNAAHMKRHIEQVHLKLKNVGWLIRLSNNLTEFPTDQNAAQLSCSYECYSHDWQEVASDKESVNNLYRRKIVSNFGDVTTLTWY